MGLVSALGDSFYPILCHPRPFMPNQFLSGEVPQLLPAGPSAEPQDEEMPELSEFQLVGEASLPSPPRW